MDRTLVKQVEFILATEPASRNSDITLTIAIWKHYYPDYLIEEDGKYLVELSRLFNLPREDNIKRVRAKFQNEERVYLPTTREVFIERAKLSIEWKAFLGYKVPEDWENKLDLYFSSRFGAKKPEVKENWQAKRKRELAEKLAETQEVLFTNEKET